MIIDKRHSNSTSEGAFELPDEIVNADIKLKNSFEVIN